MVMIPDRSGPDIGANLDPAFPGISISSGSSDDHEDA
jgi:hypothetical protein